MHRPAQPPPPPRGYYANQYRRELVTATAPLAFAAFIQHHGRPPTDAECVEIDYSLTGFGMTLYPTQKEPSRDH